MEVIRKTLVAGAIVSAFSEESQSVSVQISGSFTGSVSAFGRVSRADDPIPLSIYALDGTPKQSVTNPGLYAVNSLGAHEIILKASNDLTGTLNVSLGQSGAVVDLAGSALSAVAQSISNNQTISTSAPSGVPQDGQVWIVI